MYAACEIFHTLRFLWMLSEGSEQSDQAELAFPMPRNTSSRAQASPSCHRLCCGAKMSSDEVGMTTYILLSVCVGELIRLSSFSYSLGNP